ncbi:MAG: hypothetical protein U9P71_09855 [Campylobacterota bacterium]|nr:hypothetical protein [Campylobacterota bacterium]
MSYNTNMIKLLLLITTLVFLVGCANRRGLSMKYYNDCKEYYDSQGAYHKVCDENFIDYDEIKDMFHSKEQECVGQGCPNVW